MSSARAQSEAIGIILLTGVIVITVGTAGAVVLSGSGVASEERVTAEVSIEIADDGVGLTHEGGDSIAFEELRVVVRHGNDTWRPPVNASGVQNGDGDSRFDPSERWIGNRTLDTDVVTTVQVFHVESGALLSEARRYPSGQSLTAGPSPADSDTTDPSVTVTSPESGDEVRGGTSVAVEWNATDANTSVESIDIQYSPDGGSSWQTLVTNTADDEGQSVQVPADSTTNAKIRVRAVDAAGNTASDQSPTFTVDTDQPTIHSISPNASSQTEVNASDDGWENVSVSWTASDATTSVGDVTISIQNTTETVATANASGPSGTVDVALPNDTAEDVYDVEVEVVDSVGNGQQAAEIDAVVVGDGGKNDTTPPGVTVEAPNGGEVFRGGETTTINWSASDAETGVSSVGIAYSTDNGSAWTTLADNATNDGSYDWDIKNLDTTEVLVRVNATDDTGNVGVDTSDATFTIDSTGPAIGTYSGVTADKKTDEITIDTFEASDNTDLDRVEFTVYDKDNNEIGSNTILLSGTSESLSSVTISTSGIQPNKDYTVEAVVYDEASNSRQRNETASAGSSLKGNEIAYDDANGNGVYDSSETAYKQSDLKGGFDNRAIDLVIVKDYTVNGNSKSITLKTNSITVEAGVKLDATGGLTLSGTEYVRLDGADLNSDGGMLIEAKNSDLTANGTTFTEAGQNTVKLTADTALNVTSSTVDSEGSVSVISSGGVNLNKTRVESSSGTTVNAKNGDLVADGATFTETGGNTVSLTADDTLAVTGSTVDSGGSVVLKSSNRVDISQTGVTSGGGITVNANGGDLVARNASLSDQNGNAITVTGTDDTDISGATIASSGGTTVKANQGSLDGVNATVTESNSNTVKLIGETGLNVSRANISSGSAVKLTSSIGNLTARSLEATVDGGSVLKFKSQSGTVKLAGATLTAKNTTVSGGQVGSSYMKVKANNVTVDTTTELYNTAGGENILHWTNGPSDYRDDTPQPGAVWG